MRNLIIYKLIQEELSKVKTQKNLASLIFDDRPSQNASEMVMTRLMKHMKNETIPPIDIVESISKYFNVSPSYLLQDCDEQQKGGSNIMVDENDEYIEPFLDDVRYISKNGSDRLVKKMMTLLLDIRREVGEELLNKKQDDLEQKKLTYSTSARQTSTQKEGAKAA